MQLSTEDEPTDGELPPDDVHGVLSNERRRRAISLLAEEGSLSLRELSERIAAAESGEDPPPRDVRQSVYVSLQQTHVPKLETLDIVSHDGAENEVRLAHAAEDVTVYLEVVPEGERPFYEVYALLAVLGFVAVTAAAVGTPVIAEVGLSLVAGVCFLAVLATAVYQWWVLEAA